MAHGSRTLQYDTNVTNWPECHASVTKRPSEPLTSARPSAEADPQGCALRKAQNMAFHPRETGSSSQRWRTPHTGGFGAGRGHPWRPVDQGHFTEHSALHHGLNYLAVQQDLDCAGTHHIHLVSLVTFSENHLAGLKVDGGRPRISQKLMTDADYFHRCDLLMETQTLSRYAPQSTAT